MDTAQVDYTTKRYLEQMVSIYGIRSVLNALAAATDEMAIAAGDNFNTVQAKQWAAWSVAIEALADNRKLTDPGRQ